MLTISINVTRKDAVLSQDLPEYNIPEYNVPSTFVAIYQYNNWYNIIIIHGVHVLFYLSAIIWISSPDYFFLFMLICIFVICSEYPLWVQNWKYILFCNKINHNMGHYQYSKIFVLLSIIMLKIFSKQEAGVGQAWNRIPRYGTTRWW